MTPSFQSPACFQHELDPEPQAAHAADVRIKRIYDEPARSDGFRVLVDRLWPRGVAKRDAAVDAWAHALAPSTALRKWFGHDPQRLREFAARYRAELREHAAEVDALRKKAARQRVTLLYAARDPKVNHAAVLAAVLRRPARITARARRR